MARWAKYTAKGRRAVHRWSNSGADGIPHAVSDFGMVSFWWALSQPTKTDKKCSRCERGRNG